MKNSIFPFLVVLLVASYSAEAQKTKSAMYGDMYHAEINHYVGPVTLDKTANAEKVVSYISVDLRKDDQKQYKHFTTVRSPRNVSFVSKYSDCEYHAAGRVPASTKEYAQAPVRNLWSQ